MPLPFIIDPQIDVEMARYIIIHVGNRFCELVEQEKDAMSWVSPESEEIVSFKLKKKFQISIVLSKLLL